MEGRGFKSCLMPVKLNLKYHSSILRRNNKKQCKKFCSQRRNDNIQFHFEFIGFGVWIELVTKISKQLKSNSTTEMFPARLKISSKEYWIM